MARQSKEPLKARVQQTGALFDLTALARHLEALMRRSGLTQDQLRDLIDMDPSWDRRGSRPGKSAIQSAISKVRNAQGRVEPWLLEFIARGIEYWYFPHKNPRYDPRHPGKTPSMVELARLLEKRTGKQADLPKLTQADLDALFILSGYPLPRMFEATLAKTTEKLPAIEEMSPLMQLSHDLHYERIAATKEEKKRKQAQSPCC